MIEANCYIVGRRGKILGYALIDGFTCDIMEDIVYNRSRFPDDYNQELLRSDETRSNITNENDVCIFSERQCIFCNKLVTTVPIAGGGQRLGLWYWLSLTLNLLMLTWYWQYGATVVGMEILRSRADRLRKKLEKEQFMLP